MISTNRINLIVEQNKYSIIMKIKKYLKKLINCQIQKKKIQLLLN